MTGKFFETFTLISDSSSTSKTIGFSDNLNCLFGNRKNQPAVLDQYTLNGPQPNIVCSITHDSPISKIYISDAANLIIVQTLEALVIRSLSMIETVIFKQNIGRILELYSATTSDENIVQISIAAASPLDRPCSPKIYTIRVNTSTMEYTITSKDLYLALEFHSFCWFDEHLLCIGTKGIEDNSFGAYHLYEYCENDWRQIKSLLTEVENPFSPINISCVQKEVYRYALQTQKDGINRNFFKIKSLYLL